MKTDSATAWIISHGLFQKPWYKKKRKKKSHHIGLILNPREDVTLVAFVQSSAARNF